MSNERICLHLCTIRQLHCFRNLLRADGHAGQIGRNDVHLFITVIAYNHVVGHVDVLVGIVFKDDILIIHLLVIEASQIDIHFIGAALALQRRKGNGGSADGTLGPAVGTLWQNALNIDVGAVDSHLARTLTGVVIVVVVVSLGSSGIFLHLQTIRNDCQLRNKEPGDVALMSFVLGGIDALYANHRQVLGLYT